MLTKTLALLATSWLIATSSASPLIVSQSVLHSGNGNFILQLNKTTCIKHFLPQFIDNAFEIVAHSIGEHNLEKRSNRIVRRDTEVEQVHVVDAFDIGGAFKAISVTFDDLNIVQSLLSSFDYEIVKFIPDQDIHFNLPTKPQNKRKKRSTYNSSLKTTKKTTKKSTTPKISATTTSASATPLPTVNLIGNAVYAKQNDAPWNLVRISQRDRDYNDPYIYNEDAGSNAYVYVVDDGLNIHHTDFGGRASWGWSSYSGVSPLGDGHGTHVAGIIASAQYGVAKKANIIAVQVLNEEGNGSITSLLAGLQWVSNHAKKHKGRALINMSLGMQLGGEMTAQIKSFDQAVTAIVNEGIPLIAAAGNWNCDACDVLPASNKNVLTVGATDRFDSMSGYSCFGSCVNILAPGDDIKSTYINSNYSTTILSGTSMATPHVSGVAALLISTMENATPAKVYQAINQLASKNLIKSVSKGTPNLLLFNGQQMTS
ncbi:peptidase S8/S53 domain-containing protein [Pilobolus umbonatus]|nr:peptidase S8/S53 domain-containing protein [Pilobolus umbonatus]